MSLLDDYFARSLTDTFDVIEVEIAAPHRVRILDTGKSARNAEAIVNMAVMRRGVETHFYTAVPSGTYRAGASWEGKL